MGGGELAHGKGLELILGMQRGYREHQRCLLRGWGPTLLEVSHMVPLPTCRCLCPAPPSKSLSPPGGSGYPGPTPMSRPGSLGCGVALPGSALGPGLVGLTILPTIKDTQTGGQEGHEAAPRHRHGHRRGHRPPGGKTRGKERGWGAWGQRGLAPLGKGQTGDVSGSLDTDCSVSSLKYCNLTVMA